jgi:hypothetical protein
MMASPRMTAEYLLASVHEANVTGAAFFRETSKVAVVGLRDMNRKQAITRKHRSTFAALVPMVSIVMALILWYKKIKKTNYINKVLNSQNIKKNKNKQTSLAKPPSDSQNWGLGSQLLDILFQMMPSCASSFDQNWWRRRNTCCS